jgi:hypothetical protein
MSLEEQLKARCEAIASHLVAKTLATQAEVDACGSAESGDSETDLIVRYGDLRVLLAERQPDAQGRSERHKMADRIVLDALRGAPRKITLSEPLGDVRSVSVYPKSLNTLIELAERDEAIVYFQQAADVLRELIKRNPLPDRVDSLARCVREVGYQQRLCVWIVTHPAPGLPYPEDATAPELPAWLHAISPIEVLSIFSAHQEVNAGRLAALQALPRGKSKNKDEVSRGWGVYLANLASLLNRGAEELARDHSLAALFAQSYVHAVEEERAMERTE